MAKDENLSAALAASAAASRGRLRFVSTSSKTLAEQIGVDLGKTPNPIYDFEVTLSPGDTFRAVAYTLVVNGSGRPATRAEALGRALGSGEGKLFKLNPFLLIYDYSGNQFMAVSAMRLFGEFAKLPPSPRPDNAAFSLSPNFRNRTISMYVDVPPEDLWHATIASNLAPNSLLSSLAKIRDETAARFSEVPAIVKAIQRRLAEADPPRISVPALRETTPEPALQFDDRIHRMARTAIRSAPAIILVGAPGTGKTTLLREIFREATSAPDNFGLLQFHRPIWTTPDESWTVRDLVGGQTIVEGDLQFRPGWVLQAISENRWLVLDEVNRGDMDRIFGGLLTWLSGGSVILGMASTASNAPQVELAWNEGKIESAVEGIDENGDLKGVDGRVRYLAGQGWRLLGTYNALDAQRVFRFGAALGRRFVRVPIPAPSRALFAIALKEKAKHLSDSQSTRIEELYAAHYSKEETQLGPALFLAMCNYLAKAVDASEEAALAEAYVVHAGSWLAHLERRDLDALGSRLLASHVFSADEWTWVIKMIGSLA